MRCICCQALCFPFWAASSSSLEDEKLWCRCLVGASCAVLVSVEVGGLGVKGFDVGWSVWWFIFKWGDALGGVSEGPILCGLKEALGCDVCINVGFRSDGKLTGALP